MKRTDSTIRFVNTEDKVRLAWAVSGEGPAIVKAANWLTHLEYDSESIVWGHWAEFLSKNYRYFRYDERGIGLSDHTTDNFSAKTWAPDLETVIDAAKPEEPFVLMGISQGCGAAMSYAAKYPEKVSHLIIYGGYLRGWGLRNPEEKRRREAVRELVELGWGTSNPVFRRLYTSMFLPDGTEEQLNWFDEMCARSTTPKMASLLMGEQSTADFSEIPAQVKVPTLILHCREDGVVPFSEGIEIASRVTNSEFVQLDSRNHILLSDEPAWEQFKTMVLDFTGRSGGGEDALFSLLSDREREVYAKIAAGLSNSEVADTLFISEKTVKNHITRIFEKLDVKTRSQAIVLARDKGFNEE